MKILQVVPRRTNKDRLKKLLNSTERQLRGSRTTFFDEAKGGVLVAEVQSKPPGNEWQLLQAFVGYLDRHLSKYLESITIHYR
jgi:hypothetical protein